MVGFFSKGRAGQRQRQAIVNLAKSESRPQYKDQCAVAARHLRTTAMTEAERASWRIREIDRLSRQHSVAPHEVATEIEHAFAMMV